MDLTQKKCVPCEGGVAPFTENLAHEYLAQVPEWTLSTGSKELTRTFVFHDFKEALAFVNKVGELAESEGHHPDILLSWNRVVLTLTTHAIGGLSENDFILAAKISRIEGAPVQPRGFTFIELLIAIGVMALLVIIVFIAINPPRQIAQANNQQRRLDVDKILGAVLHYMEINKGATPVGIDSTTRIICGGAACPKNPNTVDLCPILVTAYLKDIPHDPGKEFTSPGPSCRAYNSGYTISKTSANRITVGALKAELSEFVDKTH